MAKLWRHLADDTLPDSRRRHERLGTTNRQSRVRDWIGNVGTGGLIGLMRLRYKVAVVGELPEDGGVVVALHHLYQDAMLMCALSNRVFPVTSSNFKTVPVSATYLKAYGVLWTRENAVRAGIALVRRGGLCYIAPFGYSRSKRGSFSDVARLGAAHIALDAPCALTCVTFHGLKRRQLAWRPVIRIVIGPTISPGPNETAAQLAQRYTAALTDVAGAAGPL